MKLLAESAWLMIRFLDSNRFVSTVHLFECPFLFCLFVCLFFFYSWICYGGWEVSWMWLFVLVCVKSALHHLGENTFGAGTKLKKKMKKKKSSTGIGVGTDMVKTHYVKDVPLKTNGRKKKSQNLRDKKRKERGTARRDPEGVEPSHTNKIEDKIPNRVYAVGEPSDDKLLKLRKKNRKSVKSINHFEESNEKNDASEQCNGIEPEEQFQNSGGINKVDTAKNTRKCKSKNPKKMNKKRQLVSNRTSSDNLPETSDENADAEVYQMSSGDEDYSEGMKKWITQYHQSRPGIKVLQERIDDFIMAHEAREEQARAEKLAQAAEGGWTVVVHQKGRKKTTEAESGVAVGSVAQAAVLDKMGKKKKKEVGLDFYQFNKREAHRTEIMMLQSKFEQDKKRIQQMRAARKFRPY